MGALVNGDRAEGHAGFAGRQGRCLMLAVGIPKEHADSDVVDHERRAIASESDRGRR